MTAKDVFGTWYNQLGSKMVLEKTTDAYGVTGTYQSGVSVTDIYALAGRFDPSSPSGEGNSIGWAVTYHKPEKEVHSTATWSGQYFHAATHNDVDTIVTHWLLTRSTTKDDVWDSTNVGHDTFTRDKPSAAEIEKAKLLTVGSPHPDQILALRSRK